jgi:thiamine biosynthesis lipoprotein
MGLPVSVLARGDEAWSDVTEKAVGELYDDLRAVDRLLSPYKEDSAVSRLNRGELEWPDADPLVREVSQRCEWARELTGGLFDTRRPDGGWDPSGLVKGWAAERAGRRLAAVAGLDWCLNAGGDVAVGSASGEPFVVGIQDPADPGGVVATVACVGGAVATSGTAARGAHVYDPRTGSPVVSRWASVSVTGPSLETADVLATAAFVAGDGWPSVLAAAPGYAGLGVLEDGTLRATSDWPRPR